jgi:acetate kinase
MGTRSGDLDPAVVFHLARAAGMDIGEIDALLNRRSGMLGLAGASDMRDVELAAGDGDSAARLALEIYCRRIRGYVGQYHAQLGSLDAIVFTAGVGENSELVRAQSLAGLEGWGIEVDPELNAVRSLEARRISPEGARVEVWVTPTNEEREIALQSLAAIDG